MSAVKESDERLQSLLEHTKTIAIVGAKDVESDHARKCAQHDVRAGDAVQRELSLHHDVRRHIESHRVSLARVGMVPVKGLPSRSRLAAGGEASSTTNSSLMDTSEPEMAKEKGEDSKEDAEKSPEAAPEPPMRMSPKPSPLMSPASLTAMPA